MPARGGSGAWALGCLFFLATASASAQESASESETASASASASASARLSVLLAPVQGDEQARTGHQAAILSAAREALERRGYSVGDSHDHPGRALVACQTPECVEQALDAAGAGFAIVPAVWSREAGGEELTLTLIQRSSRNLNASAPVTEPLSDKVSALLDALLARRLAVDSVAEPSPPAIETVPTRPHAWKAGPIVLLAGGAAIFVTIAVAAGTKGENQQMNRSAVAAWSALGAAAIAGGLAWWVVGQKRRNRSSAAGRPAPTLAIHPSGIDLRLRF